VLSDTTVRAMALASSPDVPASALAAVVRRDGFVATAVLQMANSCRFRGKAAVDDLTQAVVRIGLRECARLITTIGVRRMFDRMNPAAQKACDKLHKHSLFVASIVGGMNRTFALGHPGTAFTAGLLHDVGRMIICARAADLFACADPMDYREEDGLLAREREWLGIDHCAVGYQFATKNNLPEPVVRAVLNHHRPYEENHHQDLVALVATADRLANHCQREHRFEGYDFDNCPAYALLSQFWAEPRKDAFRRAAGRVVVSALRDTRAMIKAAG
jgi:putative nucleotidyltransferase with HDIG domain